MVTRIIIHDNRSAEAMQA